MKRGWKGGAGGGAKGWSWVWLSAEGFEGGVSEGRWSEGRGEGRRVRCSWDWWDGGAERGSHDMVSSLKELLVGWVPLHG